MVQQNNFELDHLSQDCVINFSDYQDRTNVTWTNVTWTVFFEYLEYMGNILLIGVVVTGL